MPRSPHERDEAARQLGLSPSKHSVATLRAMLHGDDSTRLCAIDALTRRGAAEELPAIVAAADETAPLATLAATDALRSLWVDASPLARQRTRAAIAQSTSLDLRRIDLDALPRRASAPAAPAPSRRAEVRPLGLVFGPADAPIPHRSPKWPPHRASPSLRTAGLAVRTTLFASRRCPARSRPRFRSRQPQ